HAEHGLPVALNVGDLLIGEGYRLLASSKAPAEQRAAMLRIAAEGQRELCRGQGAELCWARTPAPLTPLQVLDIFRKKTALAYERARDTQKSLLEAVWRRRPPNGVTPEHIEALYAELKADERTRILLETYKEEAIRSLRELENPNLKGLLRRVIGKIFNDTE